MDIKKTGGLISAIRKEKGLTQKELAERLCVSDRTVSKWERGAGFPDPMLLEPLADALEIPVQWLLIGERIQEESAVQSDHLLRDAIRTVYQQSKRKLGKNLSTGIASLCALLIVGFVVFGMLDRSGAFLRDVCFEVPAKVYQHGEAVGETTVTVDGTVQRIGDWNFQGKFAIGCVPKTSQEAIKGYIRLDSGDRRYQKITYYRPGITNIETGISPELYISPDLREFALELADGSVIATNSCLAALQSIEHCRYALDYEGNPSVYPYVSYYHD